MVKPLNPHSAYFDLSRTCWENKSFYKLYNMKICITGVRSFCGSVIQLVMDFTIRILLWILQLCRLNRYGVNGHFAVRLSNLWTDFDENLLSDDQGPSSLIYGGDPVEDPGPGFLNPDSDNFWVKFLESWCEVHGTILDRCIGQVAALFSADDWDLWSLLVIYCCTRQGQDAGLWAKLRSSGGPMYEAEMRGYVSADRYFADIRNSHGYG